MEKAGHMQGHMGAISREMRTLRMNQGEMLETTRTATEMKDTSSVDQTH